jgi:hypothetical protein
LFLGGSGTLRSGGGDLIEILIQNKHFAHLKINGYLVGLRALSLTLCMALHCYLWDTGDDLALILYYRRNCSLIF